MGRVFVRRKLQQKHPLEKVVHENKLKIESLQTDDDARSEFTYQQHDHLTNSIRFADAKAGALVTINGLLLKYVTDMIATTAGVSGLLFKCSLLLLITSILCSFLVVYPRLLHSKEKGIIYWEHINNYSKDEYTTRIIEGDVDQLLVKSVENNYYQAEILTKKFQRLVLGFRISLLGYSVIAAALILKFF